MMTLTVIIQRNLGLKKPTLKNLLSFRKVLCRQHCSNYTRSIHSVLYILLCSAPDSGGYPALPACLLWLARQLLPCKVLFIAQTGLLVAAAGGFIISTHLVVLLLVVVVATGFCCQWFYHIVPTHLVALLTKISPTEYAISLFYALRWFLLLLASRKEIFCLPSVRVTPLRIIMVSFWVIKSLDAIVPRCYYRYIIEYMLKIQRVN